MAGLLDRIRSVDSPDGGVVLNVENGKMFRLNPVGMRILAGLKRGASPADIVEEISREYRVDPQIAREDFDNFLSSLQECGLMSSVGGTNKPLGNTP